MVIINLLYSFDKPPVNFTGKINYNKSLFKCIFYKNKMVHRYYGPALFYCNGTKHWGFNNKYYLKCNNQKQFKKQLNEQWLS